MSTDLQPVDPSVSSTPIARTADDLPTVCVLCSHNCGLRVDVQDGRIVKVRPDATSPVTHGYSCNKGYSIPHYAHHAQRVEHPMRRRSDGSFERITWDEAITEIAAKLNAIREKHGPRAIGLIGVGGQANHMDGAFALSWLGGLGSKRWFNAFAQEKTQHFLIDQWMFDAPPSAWFHADTGNAKTVIVMGSNPRISHRGERANETFKELIRDPERKLIVVDPRETETTKGADKHLRVNPGSDAYLLLAMAATLTQSEGMLAATFLQERTRDFEALRESLSAVDIDEMAKRCGLSKEEIYETTREFAESESAAIMWDLAVEQIPFLTLVSYLIHAMAAMTGNLGRDGGMIFMQTANPPELSPKRFEEPERALASGIRGISAIGGFPMFSPTLVPEEVMIDHPERLRALFIEAANPYLSFSDTNRWREAREHLDLMVVVEPAMTETAREADYVLPTPCGYEKWEWAGFPKGYPEVHVVLRPPVIPGPAEALPEPEIYARLAEAMGVFPEPPAKLFELAEGALASPLGAMAYLGAAQEASNGDTGAMLFWGYRTLGPHLPAPSLISVWVQCFVNAMSRPADVLRALGDEWKDKNPFEIGAELFQRILDHPEGAEIARIDRERNLEDHVGFEDGLVRMAPPEMLEEIARAIATPLVTDSEYPLVLASGLRMSWNANTIQRDPAWRKGKGPHCALHLSAEDAKGLGVTSGDRVRVSTRRGAVEAPAEVDAKVRTGHVWLPNGFGMSYPSGPNGELEQQGVGVNELSDAADRCPITGIPHHKYTLCKVERV